MPIKSLLFSLLTLLIVAMNCFAQRHLDAMDFSTVANDLALTEKLLKSQVVHLHQLKETRDQLMSNLSVANNCINIQKNRLSTLKKTEENLNIIPNGKQFKTFKIQNYTFTESPDEYIQNKLTIIHNNLKGCSIFKLKLEDVIDRVNHKIIFISKKRTFEGASQYYRIYTEPTKYIDSISFTTFDSDALYQLLIFGGLSLLLIYFILFAKYSSETVKNIFQALSLSFNFFGCSILIFSTLFFAELILSNAIKISASSELGACLISLVTELIWFFFTSIYVHYFFVFNSFYNRFYINKLIQAFLLLVFIASQIMALKGYPMLASYLAITTLKTMLATMVTILLMLISYKFIKAIHSVFCPLKSDMDEDLIMKYHSFPFEFKVMVFTFQVFILFKWAEFCIHHWKLYLSENIYNLDWLYKGFSLFQIPIVPAALLDAGFIFITITLLMRLIVKFSQLKLNIIVYNFIYIIAGLFALYAVGFNLRSLALIVGALSVGIGMGLKGIINNFISGLILLIEKPFKCGDRVIIDGIEGRVINIGLRATEVRGEDEIDNIIPNVKFITNSFKNFMLYDLSSISYIFVRVSYQSDIKLASKLMIDIANSHPNITTKSKNKPWVYFFKYDDYGITLRLAYPIQNLDAIETTQSEIQQQIHDAFKHHGVEIPLPKLDICIQK